MSRAAPPPPPPPHPRAALAARRAGASRQIAFRKIKAPTVRGARRDEPEHPAGWQTRPMAQPRHASVPCKRAAKREADLCSRV